jgi:Zn-dependent protease with chaperone function
MVDDATVALVFAALFGVVGPIVARRINPAAATWLLSLGGLLAAVAGAAVLAVLAVPLIGQEPEVAEVGHWSVRALERHDPTSRGVASIALVLLVALVARTTRTAVRRGLDLRATYRVCHALQPVTGELVVMAAGGPDAYALPGRPGRIVVTLEMLRALSAQERRLMIAHERAHLRRRHHWHVTAVRIAASLNPLLIGLAAAQSFCIERWADEEAAGSDRRSATADALAHAAAATVSPAARPAGALAAAAAVVDARVAALYGAPPRLRPSLLVLAALCSVFAAIAALVALDDTRHLFQLASLAVHHSSR